MHAIWGEASASQCAFVRLRDMAVERADSMNNPCPVNSGYFLSINYADASGAGEKPSLRDCAGFVCDGRRDPIPGENTQLFGRSSDGG